MQQPFPYCEQLLSFVVSAVFFSFYLTETIYAFRDFESYMTNTPDTQPFLDVAVATGLVGSILWMLWMIIALIPMDPDYTNQPRSLRIVVKMQIREILYIFACVVGVTLLVLFVFNFTAIMGNPGKYPRRKFTEDLHRGFRSLPVKYQVLYSFNLVAGIGGVIAHGGMRLDFH
jgi:hypothetical protein